MLDELRERWRLEVQAALVGWHIAGAMSDGEKPPDRPDLPEWTTVKDAFDGWLISTPDGAADGAATDGDLTPEQLDIMVAYGWKDVDDD